MSKYILLAVGLSLLSDHAYVGDHDIFKNPEKQYENLPFSDGLLFEYDDDKNQKRIAVRDLDGTTRDIAAPRFSTVTLPTKKNLKISSQESKPGSSLMTLKTTISLGDNKNPYLTLYRGKGLIRDESENTVSIFSLSDNSSYKYQFLAHDIKIGPGPFTVLTSPDNASHHYYLTLNGGDSSLSVIDADNNKFIKTIDLGDHKSSDIYARLNGGWLQNGKYLYVLIPATNQIVFLNGEDVSILQRVTIGECPVAALLDPKGEHLYVVNYGDPTTILPSLSVIDVTNLQEGAQVVSTWSGISGRSRYMPRWPFYIFLTNLFEKGWLYSGSRPVIVIRDSLFNDAAYFGADIPNFIKMDKCDLPLSPPSLITIGKQTYQIKVGDFGLSINLFTYPANKFVECLSEEQTNWFATSGSTIFVPISRTGKILVFGPA